MAYMHMQVNELQDEVNSLREVLVEKYMQVADNLEGEQSLFNPCILEFVQAFLCLDWTILLTIPCLIILCAFVGMLCVHESPVHACPGHGLVSLLI